MTEQIHRDKISTLYQSGIANAMEVSRTGMPKSTVYRTISKLKAEVSIKRKRGSGKGRVINKNNTIHLSNLLETIDRCLLGSKRANSTPLGRIHTPGRL